MRTVWLLLQTEAARWKNRRNIGLLIVLIIVMISTICYVKEQQSATDKKIVLGLAKEDMSEYAELLLQYFRENDEFLNYVRLIEDSEQNLKQALMEGSLDAYLMIPEEFAERMIRMENLPVRAVIDRKSTAKALALRYVLEAYETYVEAVEVNCTALYRRMKEEGFSAEELDAANVDISLELIFTALGKDELFRKRLVESEEGISLAQHYKLTIIYFVMLFLMIPSGLRIIELRKCGLYARMKSMRINKVQLLSAVGLPYCLSIVVLLGIYCYADGTMERLFMGMLWILLWLPVFLLLGIACDNSRNYLFIASVLIVTIAVLGGSLIPEQFLPELFQKIASFLPNRKFVYAMGGMLP